MNRDPEDTASPPPPPPDEVLEGWIEFDPDEPPPVTLSALVGDVQPWGTALLVLAWGAVLLTMGVRGDVGDSAALIAWGGNVTGAPPLETAWRALASTFLHAGFGHVFFNALSMLLFGSTVERIYGRPGFGLLFAIGGIVASLASVAWRSGAPALSVGASFPKLTIVLMTGFPDQRERAHGLDQLIYDVIPKPFSLDQLTKKVDDALAGRPVEIVSITKQAMG